MMRYFRLTILLVLFSFWAKIVLAQPSGYYNPADGLSGAPLKSALHNIIKDHTVRTYTNLWTDFQSTDKRPDGKVWDMYSNTNYIFVTNQCVQTGAEGSCYNREHSFPSSWFGGSAPMYTDLFHLYPVDGNINSVRNNFPYAKVGTATLTSTNGSKRGNCVTPGPYTGTAFEPIDEYKGDLARMLFYMATRYENVIGNWYAINEYADVILQNNAYPVFESWYLSMLGQWHADDPVSSKEIARNEAVFAIQGNRNPFIDNPSYVFSIWGVGSTQSGEPASHITNFVATANSSSSINVTWTNTSPTALGYLVKGSTIGFSSIAVPVDGIAEPNTALVMNVTSGAGSYQFTGLNQNTTYYFKIFPFNGVGSAINYKTDGSIPQASATTQVSTTINYNWIGPNNSSWTSSTNWNPVRTSPMATDILQFNDGSTKTITDVPTQTVGKIAVSNNTKITLQSSAPATLTVSGGDTNFEIDAGSELNVSGTNAIIISLATGAYGSIQGSMTFSGGAHRLISSGAGSIVFKSASVFTAGSGFTGNAFGATSLNSVIFNSGATYVQLAGSNPFGAAAPNSVVVYNSGSTHRLTGELTPSFSGRNYANFELDINSSTTVTGTAAVTLDNLIITRGTLNFNLTANPGHTIRGNIVVQPGATLNFNPSSAGTVLLNDEMEQSISGGGNIGANTFSTIIINNGNGLLINNATTLNNLTINAGSVIIAPNRQLTVNGNFVNNNGHSSLIIKSNATGTGSLMHNSNNVDAIFERYITGNSNLSSWDFHQVAVPLNAPVTSAQFMGSYIYDFNTASQAWVGLGASTTTPLPNDKGYLIYYPNTQITYQFVGQLNNGPFTACTPTTATNHFSLVPNPYPSAIDWDATTGWTKTNISNAIWIWNPTLMQYAAYGSEATVNGGSRYIPAGQSFFVKSSAPSCALTMNNSIRLHNNRPFLKESPLPNNFLRIVAQANTNSDEAIVRMKNGASSEQDAFDVDKMFGADSAPQIYTTTSDQKQLSINALPAQNATQIVPLGFELKANGTASLNFEGMNAFGTTTNIYLEDLLLQKMIHLSETNVYTFEHTVGNPPIRFQLHINQALGAAEWPANIEIWNVGTIVYLNLASPNGQNIQVEIFDILGRKLQLHKVSMQIPTKIDLGKLSGTVIVKVIAGNQVYSKKLII